MLFRSWGSGDNIVWGSGDNIVWGSNDNIVWGSGDNIVWGSALTSSDDAGWPGTGAAAALRRE